MQRNSTQREISFTTYIDSGMTFFKEKSGLIKDKLYSWEWCEEKKAYIIRNAEEGYKHQQIIKRNRLLFSYESSTQISKDGYFWNKFDCEKYDWVERLYDSNYYICRKNGKYGIINDNDETIIDVVYPLITRLPRIVDIDIDDLYWYEPYQKREERKQQLGENVKPLVVIKITTYSGVYLLELTTRYKSKSYDAIYISGKNYLTEKDGRFGLISRMGVEIVPPNYSNAYPINETLYDAKVEREIPKKYLTGSWLEVDFNGNKSVIANNGRYYGVIPLTYEECFYVGHDLVNKYLVKENGKYGLIYFSELSKEYTLEIPIEYKSITFNVDNPFYGELIKDNIEEHLTESFTFAIVQDEIGYQLYRLGTRHNGVLGDHYQSLEFVRVDIRGCLERERNNPHLFVAQKNGKYGLLSPNGIPLTDFIYQLIGPIYRKEIRLIQDGNVISLSIDSLKRKYHGYIKQYKDVDKERSDPYKHLDMDEEVWDAMTDGQYGPYPGGDVDYDVFGF